MMWVHEKGSRHNNMNRFRARLSHFSCENALISRKTWRGVTASGHEPSGSFFSGMNEWMMVAWIHELSKHPKSWMRWTIIESHSHERARKREKKTNKAHNESSRQKRQPKSKAVRWWNWPGPGGASLELLSRVPFAASNVMPSAGCLLCSETRKKICCDRLSYTFVCNQHNHT